MKKIALVLAFVAWGARAEIVHDEDLLVKSRLLIESFDAVTGEDRDLKVPNSEIRLKVGAMGACTKQFLVEGGGRAAPESLSFFGLQTNKIHLDAGCEHEVSYSWKPSVGFDTDERATKVFQARLEVDSQASPALKNGALVPAKIYVVTANVRHVTMKTSRFEGWVTQYSDVKVSNRDRPVTDVESARLLSAEMSTEPLQSRGGARVYLGSVYPSRRTANLWEVFLNRVDGGAAPSLDEVKQLLADRLAAIALKAGLKAPEGLSFVVKNPDVLTAR